MLVFDDKMLKLAKMQETLLKATTNNRQENLKKYKEIVIEIDKQAFSSLLDEIKKVNNHNQTLEDELQFMEMVSNYYNQLYELQLGFKKVCELYEDNELYLSDLSKIDIDYINARKNIIEGYLINQKNIETNKKKLEKLNETLIEEEKNKILLCKRLLDYEDTLRKNFINAEGRIVVDGKLQYISVISEYKKLDYDFKFLLDNKDNLEDILSKVNVEKNEIDEKYKTAEICYNTNPSSTSKGILEDISKEFFRIRYRLTMIKILELLSNDYEDYEQFKEKREKILDLIKYRMICLKNLGKHISIDPFARTKVEEQLNATSSFSDNSRKISKIKKEILELSNLIDEKTAQNRDYRINLNETKELIIDTVSMHDIVSLVDIPKSESIYFEEQRVSDNQVISIKNVKDDFNMSKTKQKTASVIKRVNQMMTVKVETEPTKKIEIVSPELVIVNEPLNIVNNFLEEKIQTIDESRDNDRLDTSLIGRILLPEEPSEDYIGNELDDETTIEQEDVVEQKEKTINENILSSNYNSSIFETINPFEPMPLFEDRSDEDMSLLDKNVSNEKTDDNKEEQEELAVEVQEEIESNLEEEFTMGNDMPDAFWVTQSDETDKIDNNKEEVLSFDEQINALLSEEENTKTKKLVA